MIDEVRAFTELKVSVDALRGEFGNLTTEVRAQRAWTRNRFLGFGAGFLLLVVALILGGVALHYSVDEAHCNRTFNNATAQRTGVLSPAQKNYNIALGNLVKTLRPPAGTSPEQARDAYNTALTTFYTRFAEYLGDYQNNPLPIAPKYAC